MRRVEYEDTQGRKWLVELPDGVPDSDAAMGLHVGPPSLEPLGLPEETEIRLHNQLFHRGLFTIRDVRMRRQDVFGALQAAFKVDVQSVVQLYVGEESQERRQPRPKRGVKPPSQERARSRNRKAR